MANASFAHRAALKKGILWAGQQLDNQHSTHPTWPPVKPTPGLNSSGPLRSLLNARIHSMMPGCVVCVTTNTCTSTATAGPSTHPLSDSSQTTHAYTVTQVKPRTANSGRHTTRHSQAKQIIPKLPQHKSDGPCLFQPQRRTKPHSVTHASSAPRNHRNSSPSHMICTNCRTACRSVHH